MPCGTTDGQGNKTHFCEYPYLKNGVSSDPYSIRKEKLGGITSDDPVERRRAEYIKIICYWCSYFKDDAKKHYEQSVRYPPKLYPELIREISNVMVSLMITTDEANGSMLFSFDEGGNFTEFIFNRIRNHLYQFVQTYYPETYYPGIAKHYLEILSTIKGGKTRKRRRRSPKRSSRRR